MELPSVFDHALNVTIGMVASFGVFALVVTALVETLSMLLNTRGELLRKALERMMPQQQVEKLLNDIAIRAVNPGRKTPTAISAARFRDAMANLQPIAPANTDTHRPTLGLMARVAFALGFPILDLSKKDLENQLEELTELAENKTEAGIQRLTVWYDEQMQLVSGWYRARIRFFTFLIGFVLAGALNFSPIRLFNHLWHQPEVAAAQAEYTQRATAMADSSARRLGQAYTEDIEAGLAYLLESGVPLGWQCQLSERHINHLQRICPTCPALIAAGRQHSDNLSGFRGHYEDLLLPLGWLLSGFIAMIGAPIWFTQLRRLKVLRGAVRTAA